MTKRLLVFFTVFFLIIPLSGLSQVQDEKINTQDVAFLLPARTLSEVKRLLGLSAKPLDFGITNNGLPALRGENQPILSKETFKALVGNEKAIKIIKQENLAQTPAYESWKIVSARFIPCARPSEISNGNIVNIDQLAQTFTTDRVDVVCQLEHRLVAQPFDQTGRALPFSIHIINRPYRGGDSKSHELSRAILADLISIKKAFNIKNTNTFDVYPLSENNLVLSRLNEHIVRFYGGGLLRTLAFMSSDKNNQRLAFWSGSGANPDALTRANFTYSNLIRPSQNGAEEDDSFQIIDIVDGTISARALDIDGKVLEPSPGVHRPSIYSFLKNPSSLEAQAETLDVLNPKKFFLPNLDCASCHGITAPIVQFGKKLTGNNFSVADDDITVTADSKAVLQNELSHFINLGYISQQDKAQLNRASVAQSLINDAALTAAFINKNLIFWQSSNQLTSKNFSSNFLPTISAIDLNKKDSFDLPLINKTLGYGTVSKITLPSGLAIAIAGNGYVASDTPSNWKKGGKYKLSIIDSKLLAAYFNVTGYKTVVTTGNMPLKITIKVNEIEDCLIEPLI